MKKFKIKIIILVLLIMGILFLGLVFGLNGYVKITTKNQIKNIAELKNITDIDCILVLGAKVKNDAPSAMLSDRLDTAIQLYQEDIAPKIIMSGDHGQKIMMRSML